MSFTLFPLKTQFKHPCILFLYPFLSSHSLTHQISNPMVKQFLLLPLLLLSLFLPTSISFPLTLTHYEKTCPKFEKIVQETITNKQIVSPTTAAGTLRLLFHDCFVSGCDASVLVSTTPFSLSERDSLPNLSLPGDSFDAVVRAKTALELECPGTVSCADILALAARDLVVMMGGPFYAVGFGRLDGRISKAALVAPSIPKTNASITDLIKLFASKGFSIQEMVALSGAHTIGLAHCTEISSAIFNFSKTSLSDPTMSPRYAEGLRKACSAYQTDKSLSVFNDIMTPRQFDNVYFQNLQKGLGLLESDRKLYGDTRTRPYVDTYAKNETAFFEAFRRAMEKLSEVGVKTGRDGEIRRRCDAIN